ncbi:formyltransferase family protein [Candidatus Pelagibacter sp.]|nr:formyltransferase family protein [Candidatus Pelagibacter sp.]
MIYKKKIIFIGNLIFSYELLKVILKNKNFQIVGIVSKNNSNYNSDHFSLKEISRNNNIQYLNYKFKNDDQLISFVKKLNPDYIFCFGWSHLLHPKVLKLTKISSIGYHPSNLPKNRGKHPIIWTIFLGLNKTASCFFELQKKVDDGKILSKRILKINQNTDSTLLYKKLIVIAKIQLKDLLKKLVTVNKVNCLKKIYLKNEITKSNEWRKRSVEDGIIDWRMNAISILRLVKALKWPYNGSSFIYRKKALKVINAKKLKESSNEIDYEPGFIIKKVKNVFHIKCYDAILKITTEN